MHREHVWSSENTAFVFLLTIITISVYFFAASRYVVFVGLLFTCLKSTRSYFWLAVVITLIDAPGYLFSQKAGDVVNRLPLFTIAPQVSLSVTELFFLVFVVKYFTSKKIKLASKNEFLWVGFYLFLIFLFSFVTGMSMNNIIATTRAMLPWGYLVIMPSLIRSNDNLDKIYKLLGPVIVLSLIVTLLSFGLGNTFDGYLRGTSSDKSLMYFDEGGAARLSSSVYMALFTFYFSIGVLLRNDRRIPNWYAWFLLFASVMIIFISATRGWILAFASGLYILFVNLARKGSAVGLFKYIVPYLAMIVIVLFVLNSIFPFMGDQITRTFERMNTLQGLVEGDETAEGTLVRLTIRAPRVMEGFWHSPLIGLGFSDTFYSYSDGHVGHHNMLLNVGIVGYVMFMSLWVIFIVKLIAFSRMKAVKTALGLSPYAIIAFLIGIMIIHSTSRTFWGYIVGGENARFIVSIMFAWWTLSELRVGEITRLAAK